MLFTESYNGRDFCDFLSTNSDAYNDLMGTEEVRLLISLKETRYTNPFYKIKLSISEVSTFPRLVES